LRAGASHNYQTLAVSEPRRGKHRIHRQDAKKSEVQGMSFFDADIDTIDIVDNHPKNILEGIRLRRLTPLECERLQGFPDGWTEGVSDTQRYKMLGNAVTVNVVEAIGERFLEALEEIQWTR